MDKFNGMIFFSVSPSLQTPLLLTETSAISDLDSILEHLVSTKRDKSFAEGSSGDEKIQIRKWVDLSQKMDPLVEALFKAPNNA